MWLTASKFNSKTVAMRWTVKNNTYLTVTISYGCTHTSTDLNVALEGHMNWRDASGPTRYIHNEQIRA